jgi:hypothetical protein
MFPSAAFPGGKAAVSIEEAYAFLFKGRFPAALFTVTDSVLAALEPHSLSAKIFESEEYFKMGFNNGLSDVFKLSDA